MPFKKTGSDSYTSPSGRHFNGAQVRLYYANGGHFPGQKEDKMSFAKGGDVQATNYAKGGPVLGRERSFIKTPDNFREDKSNATDENFAKGSKSGGDTGITASPKRTGDKCLPTVKPRS